MIKMYSSKYNSVLQEYECTHLIDRYQHHNRLLFFSVHKNILLYVGFEQISWNHIRVLDEHKPAHFKAYLEQFCASRAISKMEGLHGEITEITPYFFRLLETAKRVNEAFIDMFLTMDDVKKWCESEHLAIDDLNDESVFTLQNIRHMIKKIMNRIEKNMALDFTPFHKFSEKKSIDKLLQIGPSEPNFFKGGYLFEEPYQSILNSFKLYVLNEFKNKLS